MPEKIAGQRTGRALLLRSTPLGRYRFFDDFFTGFLAALFFVRVPLDAAAVVDFFFPNAAAQLSEYFFDAPIRTIVTAYPFGPAEIGAHHEHAHLIG